MTGWALPAPVLLPFSLSGHNPVVGWVLVVQLVVAVLAAFVAWDPFGWVWHRGD